MENTREGERENKRRKTRNNDALRERKRRDKGRCQDERETTYQGKSKLNQK